MDCGGVYSFQPFAMKTSKNKKQHSSKAIHDCKDGRVACFNRNNYKFRDLKARALAWFVQIAIRRDIQLCLRAIMDVDDAGQICEGHLEICKNLNEILVLIRQRHIIDESDLATIGLTLYNFPALSHFFVVPKKQNFVRTATAQELIAVCNKMRANILNSRLVNYVPAGENPAEASDEEVLSFFNQMLPAKILEEAELDEKDTCKERFLLVDMAAPVTILKDQFLELLEREARLKRNPYDDWEEYGILPYLDLQQWEKNNGIKIKLNTKANLVLPNRGGGYTPKKIDETTKPHIAKLMDEQGPVFRGLLANASKEFREAIAWARSEARPEKHALAQEALARWFPRTYPYNLPDLEWAAHKFPKSSDMIQKIIELYKTTKMDMPIAERIRTENPTGDGSGLLRVAEQLRDRGAYPSPAPTIEDENETADDPFSGWKREEMKELLLPVRLALENTFSEMFSKEDADSIWKMVDEFDANHYPQKR